MRWLTSLLCVFVFSVSAFAAYWWVPTTQPGEYALYQDGRQIGNFKDGDYFALVGDEFCKQPSDCPAQLPPGCKERQKLPTGVVWDKVPSGQNYFRGNRAIEREDAMRMFNKEFGDKQVPDDKGKRRVTIIGSKEKCRGPLAVAQAYPEFVAVDYRPDDWAVKRQGFVVDSDPTIYVQDPPTKEHPGGHVVRFLHGDYLGDVAFKAALDEVVGRKIGPALFDPKKADGWFKNIKLPGLGGDLWMPVAVLACLAGYAVLKRKVKV